MPDMSPGLKKFLLALCAAAAALAAYLNQGCTPSQVAKADRALDAAQAHLACVAAVEREYSDLVLTPELKNAERVREALKALRACAKPAAAADAGSE